ncbi:TBC1 domain family member 24 [Bagarius yarrelli]|uniref:TBC1 domain family member 24 n=1 Tax=Bagarius yarrelli TaxID=175774 RepID=A0A556UF35_BAGYA|nr:TBC1 domain family member 24 [Bagarius yarrelli]
MGDDFGVFVDWSLMGDVSHDAAPGKIDYTDAKERKRHARSGQWVKSHTQRALVYRRLIKVLPCRSVTPDASVYRPAKVKQTGREANLKSGDMLSVALPEFASGAPVPRYCLKPESASAMGSILECLASEFPDISYCPLLPAVTALLLHWSSDEAQCFEAVARLLATAQQQRMLHQTFLAHRASCMTFGDLARKHCPAAHQHIVSLASEQKEDVAEVYSDWQRWVFGDLPFSHVSRVMDVFLVEGFKVLYRVALALLKLYRKQKPDKRLSKKDSNGVRGDLREFVKSIASSVSPDKLMEKAFAIRLFSRKEINLLQLANEKALQQKGITVQQKRCNVDLTVSLDSFCSDIISVKEISEVWSWIPERFALCQPQLLFSTATHGCSLNRFYSHSEGHEPTLLLIKTTKGEVCGAFLSTDWEERKRGGNALSFFGTGECFVFKMKPEIERYEWVIIKHPELASSASDREADAEAPASEENMHALHVDALPNSKNDSTHLSPFLAARHFHLNARNTSMFMAGNFDSVIIGGGDGNALYLDSELNHGRTGPCSTFDNPPLCSENFQIAVLEVWGFQDTMAT